MRDWEMGHLPGEISGARVLRFAFLDKSVRPTGSCQHCVQAQIMGPVQALAICQYEGEAGYYLFSCDSRWQAVADTWHETIEDALRQAEFEYEGITTNWREPNDTSTEVER
jgi:hypothetical protein